MDQYKFRADHSKMIVDAMVDEYHEYIAHRFDCKQKMKISKRAKSMRSYIICKDTMMNFTF